MYFFKIFVEVKVHVKLHPLTRNAKMILRLHWQCRLPKLLLEVKLAHDSSKSGLVTDFRWFMMRE